MNAIVVQNYHNCEIAFGKDYVYSPEGHIDWDKVVGLKLDEGLNRIEVMGDLLKNGFRFDRNAVAVKSVVFDNISRDMIESMNMMFMGCKNLERIDFTGLCSSNVRSMLNLFCRCNSLHYIDFSNLDTRNVSSMFGTFMECTSLQKLRLKNHDTSRVEETDYMFSECKSLRNIDLAIFDFLGVRKCHKDVFWL